MRASSAIGGALAGALLLLLVLPMVGLLAALPGTGVGAALSNPLVGPALRLSATTSAVSLLVILVSGTPLAWWLSRAREDDRPTFLHRAASALVDLPIVLPPAVVGIGLLTAFGRRGLFGPALEALGIELSFSTVAVVLAQVVVASPFYVRAAEGAFRRVDPDTWLVARTLGATPWMAFVRIAVPSALPGLVAGAGLAWARALGEFGATLLFAGSLRGTTQTLPLAIYEALEVDLGVAIAIAVLLGVGASVALVLLRAFARPWVRGGRP